MSVPVRVNDGNFDTLLEVASEFRFPFSDKNDSATFEAIYTYRQNKTAYQRETMMTTKFISQLVAFPNFGIGYLVEQGDCKDQGNGEYEFDRTYAALPRNRTEGASVSLTQQWWRAVVGPPPEDKYFYSVDYDITEQQFTVDGEIEYEYFIGRPAPLLKPRVFLLYEFLQFIGGAGTSPPAGATKIITDDSEVGIYKADIFYRKTPYAYLK